MKMLGPFVYFTVLFQEPHHISQVGSSYIWFPLRIWYTRSFISISKDLFRFFLVCYLILAILSLRKFSWFNIFLLRSITGISSYLLNSCSTAGLEGQNASSSSRQKMTIAASTPHRLDNSITFFNKPALLFRKQALLALSFVIHASLTFFLARANFSMATVLP